jgi:hypothetical protein
VEAGKLGIPVETVDAGTEQGLAEAAKRNVSSTPTAILISGNGEELRRARNGNEIAAFRNFVRGNVAPEQTPDTVRESA